MTMTNPNPSTSSPEIIKLTPPPRITKENYLGYNFGIRPYRKGGVRLERQNYRNKAIYHNYGHGGAGVSLAYGSARYIVDKFLEDTEETSRPDQVAVIGSGYMGLMEALILTDLGYKVTVYAKGFPKEIGYHDDNEHCITSQVAGGLWLPYGIDLQDKPLHHKLGKETYEYYRKCIETKKYTALTYKPIYLIDSENPLPDYCHPGLIEYKNVKIDFGNGKLHDGVYWMTIMMDGDIFLKELSEEAKKKGVKFVKQEFEDILDICELKEKYIFNCTGAYSRVLFNDLNIIPIAGHLIYVKKTPGCDYFLSAATKDGKYKVATYPQANKLAIGQAYEERGWIDKPDPDVLKRLSSNLDELLEWRAGLPKPKL